MYGEDVIIVAIVFGSVLSIIFLALLSNIIKAWIKRGATGKLSENKEFISALREFKEKTERRLTNLEAIIAEENRNTVHNPNTFGHSENHGRTLDIELDELSQEEKKPEKGNLRNMLNQ